MTEHSCADTMTDFFGDRNGKAGCDYIVYNSMGLAFDQPLVNSYNYNEIINTAMYPLMLSQNHTATKDIENFLAEDLVDFIYQTGKHHASVTITTDRIAAIGCQQCRKYLQSMVDESGNVKTLDGAQQPYHTVFWNTIPLVPDTIKGWVEDNHGRPWTDEMKKSANNQPIHFLKNVYVAGFTNKVGSYYDDYYDDAVWALLNPSAPSSRSLTREPSAEGVSYVGGRKHFRGGSLRRPVEWNLDIAAYIKSASECRHMSVPAPMYGKRISPDDVLDLYDMPTDTYYGRDPSGKLFRIVDGKREDVDMTNPFTGNCLGSSKLDCASDDVASCLLSGDPKSLAHCLGKLKDANMFDVARNEVNKLHPSVLARLLETFGFVLKKHSDGITRPIEFSDWENNVLKLTVTDDVAKQIKDNTKLMTYLKSVVSIVRQNPVLLECNKVTRAGNSYASKAKVETFVQPVFTSPSGKPVLDQGVLLSVPAMPFGISMPLAASLQNVMGVGRLPLGMMGMMGGGQSECINADLLRKTFNSLFTRMERSGKVLVDEDKARVENSIRKVAELERQLNGFMDDIKLFTKLSETYSLSRPVPVVKYTRNEIVSEAETKRNDAKRTLEALTESSSKNIQELTSTVSKLVGLLPAINALALGLPTDAFRRAY